MHFKLPSETEECFLSSRMSMEAGALSRWTLCDHDLKPHRTNDSGLSCLAFIAFWSHHGIDAMGGHHLHGFFGNAELSNRETAFRGLKARESRDLWF